MQNDRLAWPILLLLLTVLVPSIGVVWMMREAVRNEQLATSQRLREAYQAQLESASLSVQDRWSTQLELLAQQVDEHEPAHSFAEIISRQFFDSVLICESQGQVIYPAQSMINTQALIDFGAEWHRAESFEFIEQQFASAAKIYAQIVLEHPNSVVRARSRQAQVRCLLNMGEQDPAISVLEAQCRQEEVYDAQGRSFAATAALRLLELLEPESQSWNEIFEQLARQLRDYQDVTLTSSQRLFLMTELQRLSSKTIKWATQVAEALALEVASEYEPSFASLSLCRVSISDLWTQASLDGRVVGIYHTAAIREQLLKLTEGLPLP
jgi:hypothetical protein